MEEEESGGGTSPTAERRYPAAAVPGITRVRLSPGDVVTLVNISNTGMLVEGNTRFVPATRVAVVLEGPAAPTGPLKARIVRCQVSAVGGGKLQYRSAIAFDSKIDLNVESAAKAPAAPADAAKKASSNPAGQTAAAAPQPTAVSNRW